MKKRVAAGEVQVEGTDDILTKVLGTSEHGGRVRGQGAYVKQSTYFNLQKYKKKGRTIEERIQEGVQRFMKEETERIVQQRDAFWAGEMEKLKTAFCGKSIEINLSPDIGSQQGSCDKGAHAILKEFNLQGVKKKLDLIEDAEIEDDGGETFIEKKTGVEEKNEEAEIVQIDKVCKEGDELEVKGSTEWELAIDSPTNVVAYATVDTVCDVLHGKPLGKENARVSITRVIQGSVEIPFPIQDEIVTVEQAVGTYIAWPRDLIKEVKRDKVALRVAVKGTKVQFFLILN